MGAGGAIRVYPVGYAYGLTRTEFFGNKVDTGTTMAQKKNWDMVENNLKQMRDNYWRARGQKNPYGDTPSSIEGIANAQKEYDDAEARSKEEETRRNIVRKEVRAKVEAATEKVYANLPPANEARARLLKPESKPETKPEEPRRNASDPIPKPEKASTTPSQQRNTEIRRAYRKAVGR